MNYGSTVVENGLIEGMTNIVACVVKNKISYNGTWLVVRCGI
jgi:hypothetical protein